MKNKKKTGILAKVFILLAAILAIFTGGYFFLDKLVVPKYFGKFGIDGIVDLIDVVASLYNSPKEANLIKNGYTQTNFTNAISKLQASNYKIEDDGTIKKENINKFKGDGKLELTDQEFAALCNTFLNNGLLEDSLSGLNYLNITQLTLLDLIVTPDDETYDSKTKTYTKANVNFIIKVDTTNLREQIAEQMDTPVYLLKMIIPDKIYFQVSYDIDLNKENDKTNGTIAINGRTPEKSENLINLLISFIFNEEDEMDMQKFIGELGSVAVQGIEALGDFKFAKIGNQYGFIVNQSDLPETDNTENAETGTITTPETPTPVV